MSSDVAVIGAGPAGCSAAMYLAKQGLSVTLADKARFPRPKACGEGVMPSGLAVLEELGVLQEVEKVGKPYRGIQFTSPRGRTAVGHFPAGRHGIAIRRNALDWILLQKAKTFPNIRVLEGVRIGTPLIEDGKVVGWMDAANSLAIRSRFTFIADGATSDAAKALNVARQPVSRRRFGIRTHFQGIAGLGDLVEVYFLADGEIYLAPQGWDTALVSVLLDAPATRKFAGRTGPAFMEMIASCPELKYKMARAVQASAFLGFGPLGGKASRWHGSGWVLVGDCAGSVDPITGEGIALALLNGKMAAEQYACGDLGAAYDRRRRQLVRGKSALSKILLQAAGKPNLCDILVGGILRHPSVFDFFLSSC